VTILSDLVLKFWGVRGSIASNNSQFGSHTSCVEVQLNDEHSLFFDAGTGIRAGTFNRKLRKITLFLSHFHWDHVQGLPFISQLGNQQTDAPFELEILSGFPDLSERLEHLFDSRFHPVPLSHYRNRIKTRVLTVGEIFELDKSLRLECAPLNHPGDSYACLLSGAQVKVLYATDSDYDPVPPAAEKLFKQSDWAIVDSQFLLGDAVKRFDYGHSSYQHAIDTCARLSVKDCFLFHFDPNYNDAELEKIEQQARIYVENQYGNRGPKVWMSREGLEKRIQR